MFIYIIGFKRRRLLFVILILCVLDDYNSFFFWHILYFADNIRDIIQVICVAMDYEHIKQLDERVEDLPV
jgi:hypothetical protein